MPTHTDMHTFARFFTQAGRAAAMAAAAVAVLPSASAADRLPGMKGGAGINLSSVTYYSRELPFIDQFKASSGWLTQCNGARDAGCNGFAAGQSSWDTKEQAKLDLDDRGWVRSLPSATDSSVKYRTVGITMLSNGESHPAGKYVVRYLGKGKINYGSLGTKIEAESVPGRDVVMVGNEIGRNLYISIVETDPSDYIREVRVLPPGGSCSKNVFKYALQASDCTTADGTYQAFADMPSSRTWHPHYLNDLKGFRVLRFMDYGKTNDSLIENWADRPRSVDSVWTGEFGMPTREMIDLANTVGADPWINLPTHANDDYARNFGRMAKRTLGAGRTLILEYSNEPWNYGFKQAHWMREQAMATWPEEVAKGTSTYTLQNNWYAMRSAQLCQIVKDEFGADASRVKCALNTQSSGTYNAELALNCVIAQPKLGKPCHQFMDGVAIAPYFAGYMSMTSLRPTIRTWLNEPDGGLNKMFEEILGEDANGRAVTAPLHGLFSGSDARGAVARSAAFMRSYTAMTAKYGLPLWTYEGGQHLALGDTDEPVSNLFIAANRDPRMKKAYDRMIQDWKSAGGALFTYFSYVGATSKYGSWGAKEFQFTTSTPKWDAIKPLRDTTACWWAGC